MTAVADPHSNRQICILCSAHATSIGNQTAANAKNADGHAKRRLQVTADISAAKYRIGVKGNRAIMNDCSQRAPEPVRILTRYHAGF